MACAKMKRLRLAGWDVVAGFALWDLRHGGDVRVVESLSNDPIQQEEFDGLARQA